MCVVLLSIHKMAAGKVSERHVWGHSSSAVACTKKGTSTEAEHSFAKGRRKKEERRKKKDEQNQNFHVCFSQLLYGLAELSGHFLQ